jgi:murein DD-endopeptidase MepM/ murein hydrolase activator NlpD
MRNRIPVLLQTRFLGRAAFIALLAGGSAACSGGIERFNQPLFTGSTDNQRSIIGGDDQPMPPPVAAVPRSDVSRANLPPPVQTASLDPAPAPIRAEPPIAGRWKWSAAGGQAITVRPGDSLDILAIRYGVPSNEIARANGISSPAQLTPGKVIVIPVKVADNSAFEGPAASPAPTPARTAALQPAPAPSLSDDGASHVVQSGETLYSIARKYGVKVGDLASANRLPSFDAIRIGQRLAIPSGKISAPPKVAEGKAPNEGYGGTKVLGTVSADGSKATAAPSKPAQTASLDPEPPASAVAKLPDAPAQPTVPVQKGASQDTQNAAAAIQEAADPPSANGTSFRWPVRGRIISGFGQKPGGEKNDGINLAVPEGTSVKAAEAGTVIYAGNELSGYGNLVLIRHADGWVSAYAHNSALKVKKGDPVKRGQTIATAGATGSVNAPQVHFELRRGAKPVNPLDYLASG